MKLISIESKLSRSVNLCRHATVWGTKIKRQHGIWLKVQRYLKNCLIVNCEMWYLFFAGWIFCLSHFDILITFDHIRPTTLGVFYSDTRIINVRECGIARGVFTHVWVRIRGYTRWCIHYWGKIKREKVVKVSTLTTHTTTTTHTLNPQPNGWGGGRERKRSVEAER